MDWAGFNQTHRMIEALLERTLSLLDHVTESNGKSSRVLHNQTGQGLFVVPGGGVEPPRAVHLGRVQSRERHHMAVPPPLPILDADRQPPCGGSELLFPLRMRSRGSRQPRRRPK